MKFATKILFGIMSASTLVAASTSTIFYQHFSERAENDFLARHRGILETLGNALHELERKTDVLMSNAAITISEVISRSQNLPSDRDLEAYARRLNITHLYVTDGDGKFVRSTREPVSELPNIFIFCNKYQQWFTDNLPFPPTGLVPGIPSGVPHKFLLLPTLDKKYIVEVGVEAEFIGSTIRRAVGAEKDIISLGLASANGTSLGLFHSDGRTTYDKNAAPSSLEPGVRHTEKYVDITERVDANFESCCSCDRRKLSVNGKYYYLLSARVSKAGLASSLSGIQSMSLLVFAVSFSVSAALSRLIARRLTRKLSKVSEAVERIMETGDLESRVNLNSSDEIGRLSSRFDQMIASLQQKQRESIEFERAKAIAQTTQMLAHDVRKPFTTLKMALGILNSANSIEQARGLVAKLNIEIDSSLRSVNGLIQDVMEVGSTASPHLENTSPVSLVEASLVDVFRVFNRTRIELEYDFNHQSMVLVDTLKISRVFSNILSNAIQAMKKSGKIWIKTKESPKFVEFCIGNSGSYIDSHELEKLFDAFYTKGKKDGTGLGLAIAHKIVNAHGGKIWCTSSREVGVEFHFMLPTNGTPDNIQRPWLPTHSSEFKHFAYSNEEEIGMVGNSKEAGQGIKDDQEIELENRILNKISESGTYLKVVVIDDEPLFRNAIRDFISGESQLSDSVDIEVLQEGEKLNQSCFGKDIRVFILDINLGKSVSDGYVLCNRLRAGGFKGYICMHSNRVFESDYRVSIEMGANAFLPKPMSRIQFLKILLHALETDVATSKIALSLEPEKVTSTILNKSQGINLDDITQRPRYNGAENGYVMPVGKE